jgi:DNA mismatch endonuclease (patch repair protein)
VFSTAERSAIMRQVRDRQTTPERIVAELLRQWRFRPRLNDPGVPGKPDFVFPRRRKVIFVHGCFWHRHRCEAGQSLPASNQEYWTAKFARNQRRDARLSAELRRAGWSVLIVWECQTRVGERPQLERRLQHFLRGS